MPEAPMPPAAPADDAQEQHSPAQALAEAGKLLESVATGVGQDPSVPDEAKQLFQAALEAYKQGFAALSGGGQQDQPADPGAAPMHAGASGAQPVSMRRPG